MQRVMPNVPLYEASASSIFNVAMPVLAHDTTYLFLDCELEESSIAIQ
jgi:hypothetical protein